MRPAHACCGSCSVPHMLWGLSNDFVQELMLWKQCVACECHGLHVEAAMISGPRGPNYCC